MTTFRVTSGQVSTSIPLINGDVLYVSSGGTASLTTMGNLGSGYVYSGGTSISTTLSGGLQSVAGGTTSFTAVNSGGWEYVSSGGTAISTTVNSSGSEQLSHDGTASGTTINAGGRVFIATSGTAVNATVNSGGLEDVSQSGTTVGTTVNSGGTEDVVGTITAYQTYNVFSNVTYYYDQDPGTATFTTVNSGGFEVISGGVATSTTLNSGGTEIVDFLGTATDTVLNAGGAIDVTYLPFTSGGSASLGAGGVLTVSVGSQIYTQQLAGTYAGKQFQLAQDAKGGTLITLQSRSPGGTQAPAPCYRNFTRILTDRGQIAVEDLHVGDLVQTILGRTMAPIVWLGRREMDCARHPHPETVWPVRITANAFGPGQPHTELFLSPDHAVHIGTVLIPIRHLINRTTIARFPIDRVTYYHLELPRHDVVLAEGLPAESFLDIRDGSNYANRSKPIQLYPDHCARMWEAFACAPLIVTGPQLVDARALVASFAVQHQAV